MSCPVLPSLLPRYGERTGSACGAYEIIMEWQTSGNRCDRESSVPTAGGLRTKSWKHRNLHDNSLGSSGSFRSSSGSFLHSLSETTVVLSYHNKFSLAWSYSFYHLVTVFPQVLYSHLITRRRRPKGEARGTGAVTTGWDHLYSTQGTEAERIWVLWSCDSLLTNRWSLVSWHNPQEISP